MNIVYVFTNSHVHAWYLQILCHISVQLFTTGIFQLICSLLHLKLYWDCILWHFLLYYYYHGYYQYIYMFKIIFQLIWVMFCTDTIKVLCEILTFVCLSRHQTFMWCHKAWLCSLLGQLPEQWALSSFMASQTCLMPFRRQKKTLNFKKHRQY